MVQLVIAAAAAAVIWAASRSVRNLGNLSVRFRTAKQIRVTWNEIAAIIQLEIVNPSLQEFMLNRAVGQVRIGSANVGYFDATVNSRITSGSTTLDIPVKLYTAELLKAISNLNQLASTELRLVGEWQSGTSRLPLDVTFNLPLA